MWSLKRSQQGPGVRDVHLNIIKRTKLNQFICLRNIQQWHYQVMLATYGIIINKQIRLTYIVYNVMFLSLNLTQFHNGGRKVSEMTYYGFVFLHHTKPIARVCKHFRAHWSVFGKQDENAFALHSTIVPLSSECNLAVKQGGLKWAYVSHFEAMISTAPHPVLRSVTRRQFVESSPIRPFRTTLHNNGCNSGEIRCSATSGDMLFILTSLRSPTRYRTRYTKIIWEQFVQIEIHKTRGTLNI